MAKNTFATFGILAVLLLSLGLTSAVYTTTVNNVTLTTYANTLVDVSAGETYDFDVTIENLNTSDYYVVFGTTGWAWNGDETNLTGGSTENYTGTMTIPTSAGSKSVIAKFYNAENHSELLFQLTKSISLTYVTAEVTGCMNTSATNYDPDATTHNESMCTYAVPSTTFCSEFSGEKGHLEISEIEVTNNGAGDDEEWEYLDEIVIEVTVENTDDENIDDVIVEILIKDEDDNTVTKKDMDLDDDEFNLGKIKDEEEETATFKIEELPIDLESGNYKMYIRAYEEDNENNECVSESEDFTNSDETYFEFEVAESEDSTVIVKRNLENIKASCGERNVEVKFMVYNTGDEDEDKVLVTLENSKLGIYEKTVIDNLRDGKGKEVAFYISIPEEVAKNSNTLEIYTYYDYDDDEDELDENAYGESSEEEGDDFSVGLEILSCTSPEPIMTANLESVAEVGQNLVVKARILNNGKDANFVISASDFESWADMVSVTPQTAPIKKGEAQEVTITLSPKQAGSQTFKINTIVDGNSYEQAVSLSIAEKPGIFGFANGMGNLIFYIVIGIVAVLALIFLVLIVRISQRKAQF